jgi:hypothetical protein
VINEFFDRIDRFVSGHEMSFPATAGFSSAVAEARKVVDAVPSDFSFTFHLKLNPTAMGGKPDEMFPRLLAETEGWLGVYCPFSDISAWTIFG